MRPLAMMLAVLAVVATAGMGQRAQAAVGALTLELPPAVRAGDSMVLRAVLTDDAGAPIADAGIAFQLDGAPLGRAVTDADGVASKTVSDAPAAGTYTIAASYDGRPSLGHAAVSARATLAVGRAVTTLQTVPELEGVQVKVGDEVFTSDARGVVRLEADAPGVYEAEVLPWASADGLRKAAFVRWDDDLGSGQISVKIPASRTSYLGFEVSYLFSLDFVDLDGQPVEWGGVQSAVLRGSTTAEVRYDSPEPRWLLANRLLRQGSGLVPTPVQYAVKSVSIDGADVVNSQQQRFLPTPGGTYTAQVLMFDAHVRVTDAVFGRAAGDRIVLEYPDGSSKEYAVPADGELTIPRLPRGDYRIRPIGGGLSFARPLAMSREQEVELQVITYADMALGGSVAAVLFLGVLVVGRRAVIARRASRLGAALRSPFAALGRKRPRRKAVTSPAPLYEAPHFLEPPPNGHVAASPPGPPPVFLPGVLAAGRRAALARRGASQATGTHTSGRRAEPAPVEHAMSSAAGTLPEAHERDLLRRNPRPRQRAQYPR